MKKRHLILLSATAAALCSTLNANILITGVFDGALDGGLPKGIELYVTSDISDLGSYGIGSANNGGGTDNEEFTFSGSANQGDYIWIASESDAFQSVFGFAPTFTDSAASINGDDAIELFFNGNVIDTFGDINKDGNGEPWEYMDSWAYRIDGTTANAAFSLTDWSFPGPNALDNLTATEQGSLIPLGTYTMAAVPEPSTIAAILGLCGLAFVMIRRRR